MKKIIVIVLISLLVVGCSNNESDKKFKVVADGVEGSHINLYTTSDDNMKLYLEKNVKTDIQSKYKIDIDVKNLDFDSVKEILESYSREGVSDGKIDLLILKRDELESILDKKYFYTDINKDMSNYNEKMNELNSDFSIIKDYKDRVFAIPFYRKQFVFLYDNDVLETHPKDMDEFLEFLKENKNTFTYPDPSKSIYGSSFIDYVVFNKLSEENLEILKLEENKEKVKELLKPAMEYLLELDDYILKKDGKYYDSIEEVNTLFKEGRVYFSFSDEFSDIFDNSDNVYPSNTKSFSMGKTSVDTYYLLVPNTSKNKGGAFVVINDLISFETQLSIFNAQKLKVLPVIDVNLLDSEKKEKFKFNNNFVSMNELLKNREYQLSVNKRNTINEVFNSMLEDKKKQKEKSEEESKENE